MKRLLSLLVVIAMVVSMVPSVFAAKEDVDFDELTGRLVVLEDIKSFEVALAEGSDGMIYQWTPAENCNLALSYTAPEGTDIIVTVTQGEATATAAEGAVALDVWADQVVEIEVSEAAGLAAEFTIEGTDFAVPGSDEWNGIFLGQMENTVTAAGTTFTGATTWYQGYFSGTVMTITGTGAYNVSYNGETIAAVDGVVSTAVATSNPRMPVVFAIDTVGEYTISFAYAEGTSENPAQLVMGQNTASIEAGSQGYYYTWTAEKDGTLTITMPEGDWTYVIHNLTSYAYGDTQWSDSDPVVNPAEVEVAAGDELQIMVNSYDPANMWTNPAAELVITAAFAEPKPDVPPVTITAQPSDKVAKLESVADFTVVAEGEGLTYQWMYSNNGGASWTNTGLPGYNTATLSVPVLASRHNYQYKCVVTDAENNVATSEPATLKVPYITVHPEHFYGLPGDVGTFHVEFSVEGATYQWQYKNPAVGVWYNTSKTGATTDTLSYEVITTNNQYSLRCIVTYVLDGETLTFESNHGSIKHNGVLPEIAEDGQPSDITVRGGATAPFTVETKEEYRSVTYQWEYKKPGYDVWWETRMPGYNEPTLNVIALYSRDGYQYRCIIRTPGQKTISEEVTLTVLPAVDITAEPESQTVAVGETATFFAAGTCDEQTVAYQWQYSLDGVNWSDTSATGAATQTMTIVGEARLNGRYFRCRLRNEHNGEVFTKAVQLFVQ